MNTNLASRPPELPCCRWVFPQTKPEEWKFTSAEGPGSAPPRGTYCFWSCLLCLAVLNLLPSPSSAPPAPGSNRVRAEAKATLDELLQSNQLSDEEGSGRIFR